MQVQFSLEWQCQYAYELGMREATVQSYLELFSERCAVTTCKKI